MLIDVYVVCNLAQVVYFDAFSDEGGAHGGAVYAAIGADFDVVFNDDIADLRNFAVGTIFIGGKTETI